MAASIAHPPAVPSRIAPRPCRSTRPGDRSRGVLALGLGLLAFLTGGWPAAATASSTNAPADGDADHGIAPAAPIRDTTETQAPRPGALEQAADDPGRSRPADRLHLPDWPELDQRLALPPWLSLQLQATAAPIANPIGGLRSAAGWMQQIELDLSAGSGLSKTPGSPEPWREVDHWQADLRLDLYNGSPGYGTSIGSVIAPQTIDDPTGLWLSGASLTRRSQDDRLRLTAGLLSMDQDFVVAPAYNAYLFASINNTLNLNILGLPITPFVAPGGSVRWQNGGLGEWRLGAYWLDPEIRLASLFGVDTGQPAVKGNLQILQWSTAFTRTRTRFGTPIPGPGGGTIERQLPPPLLQLGALRSQVQVGRGPGILFPRALPAPGSTALNRVIHGSVTLPASLSLGLDNRIWAAAQLGVDPSVNPTPLFLAAGWLCQGPSPQRPLDVLAIGVARSGFSTVLLPDLSWQAVVEVNYNVHLNRNLSLQPLVQWILQPAGNGRQPAIVTTGLQLSLSF